MSEEAVSNKSSVTIHLPAMSPALTDVSVSDRDHSRLTQRLPTLNSESSSIHDSIIKPEIVINDSPQHPPEIRPESTEILLMTEKEIKDWDEKLADVFNKLQAQQQQYFQWENDLKRRRMIAFEKLKKLRRFREKRFELYECVERYIAGAGSSSDCKTDTEKSELGQT